MSYCHRLTQHGGVTSQRWDKISASTFNEADAMENQTIDVMSDINENFAVPKQSLPALARIKLSDIRIREQVRKEFGEQHIDELANSIKKEGQRTPVEVTKTEEPGIYELLTGERRYRALTQLQADSILAIVVETPKTDNEKTALQLIENIQREDLTPLEIASAIHKLSESGLAGKDIAERTGKSTVWVSRYLSLNKLPKFIAELLQSKATADISMVLTLHKVAKLDEPTANKLAKAIKAKRIGRMQVEDTLEQLKSGKAPDHLTEQALPAHQSADAIKYRLVKPEKFAAQVQAKLESGEKVQGRLLIDRFATNDDDDVAEDWCWIELEDSTKVCVKTSSIRLQKLNSL